MFPSPDYGIFQVLFFQINFLFFISLFSFWHPHNVNTIALDGVVEFLDLFSLIIIIFLSCSARLLSIMPMFRLQIHSGIYIM